MVKKMERVYRLILMALLILVSYNTKIINISLIKINKGEVQQGIKSGIGKWVDKDGSSYEGIIIMIMLILKKDNGKVDCKMDKEFIIIHRHNLDIKV